MPTFMLEGQTPARLSPKPITVRLQLAGPVPGRLVALADGAPLADAVRPRPELLVLPNVQGTVRLRIEPVGATVFVQGSIANVSVSVNDPGAADPERAVLPPVDLAGLAGQVALAISRDGDALRVRSEVRPTVQITLGPLADAARVVATELVGTQRLDDAIDVAVAIDASASFHRRVVSGQVRRAIDVIDGIAAVIDPDRAARASILSTPERAVAPGAGETLGVAIERAFGELVPETGAPLASGDRSPLRSIATRNAAAQDAGHEPARTLTFVLTDAAPADRAAFESLQQPGRAVHLVVIGNGSAWRLQRCPSTPATLFDLERLGAAPAAGDSSPDPLAHQAPALRELVAGLLQGRPE